MNPHADRDASEQPSDRTATPDAGTTREQEGHDVEACPWCRMGYPNWCAEQEALRAEVEAERSNADHAHEHVMGWRRRAEAAEAIVEQVRALAEERDVTYPPKFKFGASENYVLGTRHTRAEVLAILDGAQTPQTTTDGPETPLSRPGSASGGTETGEALEGAQRGEE